MGAPTVYYVDPSINANSGSGTLGSPWGDLQFALNSITRDATNGDIIHVKAGTSEFPTAALSLATYGTPTAAAPLVLRGYTSAAGDGGIGTIDGGGSLAIWNSLTTNAVHARDMRFTNTGASIPVTLGTDCCFENCRIDNTTTNPVRLGNSASLYRCRLDNYGGPARISATSDLLGNVFDPTPRVPTSAVQLEGATNAMLGNRLRVTGSAAGIIYQANGTVIRNNAVAWVSGTGTGTGAGISTVTNSLRGIALVNNYVEGFAGTGGCGVKDSGATTKPIYSEFGYNKVYNCTTAFDVSGDKRIDLGSDATLGASGLTSASGGDYTPTTALDDDGYPAIYSTF